LKVEEVFAVKPPLHCKLTIVLMFLRWWEGEGARLAPIVSLRTELYRRIDTECEEILRGNHHYLGGRDGVERTTVKIVGVCSRHSRQVLTPNEDLMGVKSSYVRLH